MQGEVRQLVEVKLNVVAPVSPVLPKNEPLLIEANEIKDLAADTALSVRHDAGEPK